MTTTDKSAQKHYEAIKDVVLTDFLDVETETTFKASEIWKEKPIIVIGKNMFCLLYDVLFCCVVVHFRNIADDTFVHSCNKLIFFNVVIRRPGCPFCREEARILDEHRDLIEKEMVGKILLQETKMFKTFSLTPRTYDLFFKTGVGIPHDHCRS